MVAHWTRINEVRITDRLVQYFLIVCTTAEGFWSTDPISRLLDWKLSTEISKLLKYKIKLFSQHFFSKNMEQNLSSWLRQVKLRLRKTALQKLLLSDSFNSWLRTLFLRYRHLQSLLKIIRMSFIMMSVALWWNLDRICRTKYEI